MSSPSPAVTRQQLASYLKQVFDAPGTVGREDIVAALDRGGAPTPAVKLVTDRVPVGARFADIRAFWHYFGDVPVEAPGP